MARKAKVDVLMISRAYPPVSGGVAAHVSYLVEALTKLTRTRTDPTLVCRVEVVTAAGAGGRPHAEGTPPFLIVHRLYGQSGHFTAAGEVPFDHAVKYLLDHWHKIRPDIIHAHDFEALQIAVMLKTAFRVPVVFTVHRTPKDPDPTLAQRDVKDCYLQMVRRFGLADWLVAPSEAYRQHLVEQGFALDRIDRVYHGVPVQALSQLTSQRGVLDRLGLVQEDELVLSPIRLDPHKRPEVFIEAAALVKKALPGRSLVFATAGSGSEEYRKRLERLAKDLGLGSGVRLGASDGKDFAHYEMPTLYRRAKICVLPSSREGFGQVILEAGVFHTPVVAANTGGIPEIVVPRETGLLFNRDEPQDLAQQIRALLDDPSVAQQLAARAAVRVSRHFDASRMALNYLKLYQRAAGIALK